MDHSLLMAELPVGLRNRVTDALYGSMLESSLVFEPRLWKIAPESAILAPGEMAANGSSRPSAGHLLLSFFAAACTPAVCLPNEGGLFCRAVPAQLACASPRLASSIL